MAMRLDLNAIVNEFIRQADAELVQSVMKSLGPRECREVETRFIDIRGHAELPKKKR